MNQKSPANEDASDVSDINLGRWVDVPAMLVRTFAQAVLLPCF